jgi:hypothetical protein
MKNLILKSFIFIAFILNLTACGNFLKSAGAAGTWENTIKNTDGSSVVTTLEIKEAEETFTATMNARIIGNESETLKLLTSSIKLSGVINDKILTITDTESDSDTSSIYSRLVVSKDGSLITMSPGEIKFHKKIN